MVAKGMIMRPKLHFLLFETGPHQSYAEVKGDYQKHAPLTFVMNKFQLVINRSNDDLMDITKNFDQELVIDIPHGIHQDFI